MYNTILVPIDMSHVEKAKSMIDAAKTQANEGAKIILLNVVEAVPTWAETYMPDIEAGAGYRQSAHDELVAVAKANSLDADIRVETGHSYNTILKVAEETGSELIVIGSHHPGISDYFLGSTAAKVVRHAKCSVYVIR